MPGPSVPRRYTWLYVEQEDGTSLPISPRPSLDPRGVVCPCAYHQFCRQRCLGVEEMFPAARELFKDEEDDPLPRPVKRSRKQSAPRKR